MRHLAITVPLWLLGACTMGPDFEAPAPPPPQAGYADAGAARASLGEGAPREWWKAFGSPALDALVERALAHNQSLAASRATLTAAREQVLAANGRRLPQVDAGARAQHQRINFAVFGLEGRIGTPPLDDPEFSLFTLGAGVSYDLDLFGGIRRAVERTAAQAEAQQRETEAAHLTVATRVVLQALAIAALNDRIAAEQALLVEDERNVRLTDSRRRAGVGTLVEVLSAEGQLAADRANLPALRQQLAEGRAMLAVLLGISPAELGETGFSLADMRLPGTVPVALPSALVRRRPDILAAEARFHAATAAIGMAEAQLYPNVTLGASLTQAATRPGDLLTSTFRAFDVFSGLTAPIFHGGTLRARKRAAVAEAEAAAAAYRQVVLEAFGQVSGLLSALATDGEALAAQQRAAQISARSLHLSRRSFEVGNSGVLQVLDANRADQRARLSLIDVRARQALNIARLHAATAGGWNAQAGAERANPSGL